MKILLSLSFAFLVASVSCMTAQEQKAMLSGIAQECRSTEGASDNDLSLLILKKPMTSKEGKCMLACILEQAGIVENNAWNDGGFKEFVSNALNNDESKIKKADATVQKCKENIKGISDRCEMAIKMTECMKKGLKKEKIDIGF